MKNARFYYSLVSFFPIAILFFISNTVQAQVDTVQKPVQVDSVNSIQTDTSVTATKTDKKAKKDKFLIYAGANFNQMDLAISQVDSKSDLGYHIGVAYKRGSFFYWQVGARYNNAAFNFVKSTTNADTGSLTVKAIDIPLTAGINFLSFADRLVGLRVFVSAVPSFTLGVGDNELKITKDDVNSFIFYGQAGIGVDIAFFMIETGYNYGFQNLLKDYSKSNPGQFYVSLGFRF